MSIWVRVLAPSLPPDAAVVFENDVRVCFEVYRGLRRRWGLPASKITAVLADDFAGEVQRRMWGAVLVEEGGDFVTARVGGEVGAKNLDQTGDASVIDIVFNARNWQSLQDPVARLDAFNAVAHELAHPVIERARHAAGAMDGVIFPSVTGRESARSMARIMAGEYRADRLADVLTAAAASATVNGIAVPAHVWTFQEDTWLHAVFTVVEQAHPAWPDLVQSYREWQIPLGEMWGRLATLIDQTLTILVHAQANADAAETGLDLLDDASVVGLPATVLYLAEPMRGFVAALRRQPVLARLRDTCRVEEEVIAVGAKAITEIWRRLGLTIEERPNREWALWVAEPNR